MSILIKGMEMPTRCCFCKIYVEDIYYCPMLGREIENPWADDGVELDCPLVPVPPHGDLIDRDALKNVCKENAKSGIGLWVDYMDISLAPTIIPAEEGE